MRLIKKAVTLLLIGTLAIWPVIEAMAQEELPQDPEAGKVIVLSDKVGEIIDLEERNFYQLFLFSENFQSAIILQLPDSSLVIQITEMKEGVQQQLIMQVDQEILEEFREIIEKKPKLIGIKDQAKIFEAKKQAKILAKEKWTKERWREESLNDRGLSYRTTGTMLGFTLEAAAGMLIGKGFQGRKERKVETYHEGGWGEPWTYTEYFYSYEHKHAPHWGAAIGGIAGAGVGYFLGKKADKEYYILVPQSIRVEKTKSSWFENYLVGFGVVGPITGAIAGWALYTPTYSENEPTENFWGGEFLGGYLVGAIVGTKMMAALKGRAKRKKLGEASLLEEKSESSLDIEFIPLDPTAFSIYPRMSPSGEIFYEYRMEVLRVRF